MSRLGLLNMSLGFLFIFIASSCGAFLANDSTYALMQNKDLLASWSYVLRKSAHAHTNFFGMLHILFGLTLPYSPFSRGVKAGQTFGFLCGSVSMSVMLLLRSFIPVIPGDLDILGAVIGFLLTCALLSLASHCFALFSKFLMKPS